ncbi:uncharacterized protein G2W53_020169 [Senna tora]|uniref:Uncharacterized protein n=1 Tax=Senna tora TaxID=362788 RepID=A0A834TUX7_9FABA|nr:uncharacterized protein G2W53_020169 [Senna tora]
MEEEDDVNGYCNSNGDWPNRRLLLCLVLV